jgi:formylglycine-generating enzyme required for sulfatase activity
MFFRLKKYFLCPARLSAAEEGDGPENTPPATPGRETGPKNPKAPPAKKRRFRPAAGKDPRGAAARAKDYHRDWALRVSLICFSVFIIMLAVWGGIYFWRGWRAGEARKTELAGLERVFSESRADAAALSGGAEKSRAALRALSALGKIRTLSPAAAKRFAADKDFLDELIHKLAKECIAEGKSFVDPVILAEMVHIPPGGFIMGLRPNEIGDDDETPPRLVQISRGFWLSSTEVTNKQFRVLFPNHHTELWKNYVLDADPLPVVKVDWHTAKVFCRKLTDLERASGRLPPGYVYRLPTEAEWECACRAGTKGIWFWGDKFGETGKEHANTLDKRSARLFDWRDDSDCPGNDSYPVAAPAGSFKPNNFGLYDMIGNVWEWCYDWYNPKAYSSLPAVDPVQTEPVAVDIKKIRPFDAGHYFINSTARVIRGGSWGNTPSMCRAANRDFSTPEDKNTGIGFRVALAPAIERQ